MTAPSHKTFRFHLLALLVVAIWGVTFVCTKVLIGAGMAPAAIFVCRFMPSSSADSSWHTRESGPTR